MSCMVYCEATYSNEISTVYDIFMNFFVIPREIQEINKQGIKISCGGGGGGSCKNHDKINIPCLF